MSAGECAAQATQEPGAAPRLPVFTVVRGRHAPKQGCDPGASPAHPLARRG